MARNLNGDGHIRVASEEETKSKFYKYAKEIGCEIEYVTLYRKYADLISKCHNEKERDDLRSLGALEITNLLFGSDEIHIVK